METAEGDPAATGTAEDDTEAPMHWFEGALSTQLQRPSVVWVANAILLGPITWALVDWAIWGIWDYNLVFCLLAILLLAWSIAPAFFALRVAMRPCES